MLRLAPCPHARPSAQAGLTLIELMIAMVLGLMVIGAATQIFLSGRAAYAEIRRFISLQENVGFLWEVLGNELREVSSLSWDAQLKRITISPAGPFGCKALQLYTDAVSCLTAEGAGTLQALVGGQPDAPFNTLSLACPDAANVWQTPCANPTPTALRLEFGFQSIASGKPLDHTLSMTFALRNNVLAAALP